MQSVLNITRSSVARIAGLALVTAMATSFIGLSHADVTHQLTVNVTDACGPVVAQVTVVNGPDDGAFGITNAQGQFVFNSLHAGVFYLHVASANHNSKDTGSIVLNSNQTVNVALDRSSGACPGTTPTPTPGPIDCVENATVSLSGPATLNPGEIGTFRAHVVNNGDTWWYHGSYFQLVQKSSFSINPDLGLYSPSMHTGNSRDFTFTLTAPVAPGTYTLRMQNVHHPGADYQTDSGTTCAPAPASDVYFGQIGAATFTVSAIIPVTPPANNPPQGYLDVADCLTIVGWATDSDTPNSAVSVEIYKDGPVGSGTLISTIAANQFRNDVGNHGFSIATPAAFKDTNSHQVYAYALDTATGNRTQLISSPRTLGPCVVITNPGTISALKTVRNLSQSQSVFLNSVSAAPGDNVEFKIQVTASNGEVNNVTVADFPPSRFIYVNNSLTIDGNISVSNLGSISLGDLVSNQTKTIIFRATVADASQFSVGNTLLTNIANVRSSRSTITASASVLVNVNATTSSLSLTKLVRNTTAGQTVFVNSTGANPGDLVQFQIQVTNNGSGQAQNVIVTDTLPNNLTLSSGSTTLNVATLNPGASQTLTLSATIANASNFNCGITNLTNHANATANNTNSVSASAQVGVNSNNNCGGNNSNLTINKSARNLTQGQNTYSKSISANAGDQVQFQIQVSASGNTAAQNVNVTDTLPGNMSLNSGNTNFSLGTMNVGSSQTVTLTATINNNGNFNCNSATLTNTATVNSSNASSTSDSASVLVNSTGNCGGGGGSNFTNLTLSKEVRNVSSGNGFFTSSVSASNGDQVQFRITVRNNNFGFSANNVRLTDNLPFGLTYVPGSFQVDSGSNSGSLFNGTEYLGTLSPSQSRTVIFNATVAGASGQILTNVATASADNANSVTAQASVNLGQVLGGNVSLVLNKRAFNQTRNVDAITVVAQAGDIIVYTLTVTNQGNSPATNFIFQDDVADILQLSMLQEFGDATFNLGNLNLTWPVVTISPGATVTKTFTVKVNASVAAGQDNVMTNTFGNTVNVQVIRPQVAGAFTAPPTGTTTNLSLIFAFLSMGAYVAFKKKQDLKSLGQKLVNLIS